MRNNKKSLDENIDNYKIGCRVEKVVEYPQLAKMESGYLMVEKNEETSSFEVLDVPIVYKANINE